MTSLEQKRKLNTEVAAIMRDLDLDANQRDEIYLAYVVAQDLALRQAETELQTAFARHRALDGTMFDAVSIKDKLLLCAEVLFLTEPDLPAAKLAQVLEKSAAVKNIVPPETAQIKLLLLLVTQFDTGEIKNFYENLRRELRSNAPVDVTVKIFDFAELQNTFLNE